MDKATIKMYIDEMKEVSQQQQNATYHTGYIDALDELWDIINTNEG